MRNAASEVWVTTGGSKTRAEEYALEVKPGQQVHECYIEAKPGEYFAVNVRCPTSEVAAKVYLDGEEQAFTYFAMDAVKTDIDSKRVGHNSVRKFMFSKINLTDDNALACTEEQVVKNLGTITVKLYRVIKQFAPLAYSTTNYADEGPRTFHEMSKKARLSATTGFGAAEYAAPSTSVTCDWIDSPKYGQPWATYTFYYRSGDLLEAEGKRSPTKAIEPAASSATGSTSQRTNNGSSSSGTSNNRKRRASDDDQSELERLREENQRLRAERDRRRQSSSNEVELKPSIDRKPQFKSAKREVIVIDDSDSD